MEQADAFAVLLCSQSKRRKSTDQKDKYATCPVCGTSVPKAFLHNHTDDCLVKSQQPAQPSQQQRKVPRTETTPSPTGAVAAAAAGAATSPVKAVQSPQQLFRSPLKAATNAAAGSGASQRPFLTPKQRLPPNEFRAMVSAGWDKALRHIPEALEEPPSLDDTSAQQSPQAQAQHTTPMQSPRRAQPAEHRAPAAALGTQGAVDAFAVLRSAQVAQKPMEAEMFLEGRGDGSYVFHWRLAGAPWAPGAVPEQAAWSATVNANLPWQQHAAHTAGSSSKAGAPAGSVKLRLEISTNIPPGFGAAIDWDNPLLPSNGLVLNGPASSNQDPHGDQQFGPEWEEQQQQQGTQGFEPAAGSGRAMRWRGGGAVALISALQKSVRRGCAASATRIALELLKDPKNAEALTRRLSIICLEDGLLHPQLPLVVWTMMALSKGYVVGGHLANALLMVTHQMAFIQYRDFLPMDPPPVSAAGVYTAPSSWHAVDAALGVSSQESILVKCMLIRAAYGGMSCDKDMLLSYAGLWTARFSGCTLPPPPPPAAAATAAAAAPATPASAAVGEAGLAAGQEAAVDMQHHDHHQQQQQQQQSAVDDLDEAGQQHHQQEQHQQEQQGQQGHQVQEQLPGQPIVQQPGVRRQALQLGKERALGEQLSPAPQQEGVSGHLEGQQQVQQQEHLLTHAQHTDVMQRTQGMSGMHHSQLLQESAEGSAEGEGASEELRPQWLPRHAEQQQPQVDGEAKQQQQESADQQMPDASQQQQSQADEEQQQQQQQPGPDQQMADALQLRKQLQGVPAEVQVPAASPGRQQQQDQVQGKEQILVLVPVQRVADTAMPKQLEQQQTQAGAKAEEPCVVQERQQVQQGSCPAGATALDSSRSQEVREGSWDKTVLQHQQQHHHVGEDSQMQQQEEQQQQQEQGQGRQQSGVEQHQQRCVEMQEDQQQPEEGYDLDSEPSLQQSDLYSPVGSLVQDGLDLQGTSPDNQQPSSHRHHSREEADPQNSHSAGHNSAQYFEPQNASSPGLTPTAVAGSGAVPSNTSWAGGGSSTGVPDCTVRPGSTWLRYLQLLYSQTDASDPQRVTVLASVRREDIILAAIDMHVAPALIQHLKEQPKLKAAVRSMIATSTSVAARLSAPDGFDCLINSALWHCRSSINRKHWLQEQYMHAATAAGAAAGPGGCISRQQLEAAAMAAVAAWSGARAPPSATAAAGTGGMGHRLIGIGPGGSADRATAGDIAPNEAARHAAGAGAASMAVAPALAPAGCQDEGMQDVPAEPAAGAVWLQPGVGFSEGALRVLEMELNALVAHDAQQRQTKQELMPLMRAGLAPLADAWCREYVNRRLY